MTVTAADEAAFVSLQRSLNRVLSSGNYSDIVVRLSDGSERHCHRAILCSQCEFFATAVKLDSFKEGNTGVVEMCNDPPRAIKALIEFLYTTKYAIDPSMGVAESFLFHVDVYIIAMIYGLPLLRNETLRHVSLLFDDHWQARDLLPVFPGAVKTIYEHVSEEGCVLRSKLQAFAVDYMERLVDEKMLGAWAEEVPEFTAAVMGLLWEQCKLTTKALEFARGELRSDYHPF